MDAVGIPCYLGAMSETGMELLEKIMALDPAERRAVAEEILARVQESDEDAELLELAEARWSKFESAGGSWMTHEDLMKSLRR